MANRSFTTQFYQSLERQPVHLMGAFTQSGNAGARASLTSGDDTFTASAWGPSGNAITIALIDPGVDGGISVAVVGNAISVTLAYALGAVTSDYEDLAVALQSSIPASALITTTGSSGTLVTPISATHLAGGAISTFTSVIAPNSFTLTQTDTGEFTITLADTYGALLSGNISLCAATLKDLSAQFRAVNTLTTKVITFRTFAIGSGSPVATNLASGDTLYIDLCLRNSSN